MSVPSPPSATAAPTSEPVPVPPLITRAFVARIADPSPEVIAERRRGRRRSGHSAPMREMTAEGRRSFQYLAISRASRPGTTWCRIRR